MIWKICYILSIAVILPAVIIYIHRYRIKKVKLSSALKPLFAGFSIGLFVLLLPIQLDAFGTGFADIVKAVLASVNRTLRAFVLTDINFMKDTQSIDKSLYPLYSTTLMILCFVCPFISLSYILTFFSKLKAGLRFAFVRFRHLCVFSCLNEGSLALAQDLSRKHPSWRMVFCGVSDPVKGANEHLINSAERIRAICFTKDILSVNLTVHSKKKQLLIFAISDDEQKNTNDALGLLSKFRDRDGVGLYLFSTLTESSLMLSGADCGKVRVRRIDMPRSLIYRMLYDQGNLLFGNAEQLPDGTRRISAVIVGLGACGMQMLKALTWYCQMNGYTLVINGFDRRHNARRQLEAMCPDILDPVYNETDIEGEANYTIHIHDGVEIQSGEFNRLLSEADRPTFAFVALGDDSVNIDESVRLRILFERRRIQPEIFTVIRNSDKKQLLDHAKNYKGQEYHIHTIGDDASAYSEQEILSSEIEEEALRLHKEWGDEESFWRYEYNYQSSLVRAIHSRAVAAQYPSDRELTDSEKLSRAVTEHKRWNAYMRTQGYTYSGSTQKSSRNDLGKLHNDLVPFSELEEAEKQKDFSLG